MNSQTTFTLRGAAAIFAILAILMTIIASRPKVAYNSGSRERLAAAMWSIRDELDPLNAPKNGAVPLLGLPRVQAGQAEAEFRKSHSISVSWHDGKAFHEMHFVPIAVETDSSQEKNARQQFPLVVMVPTGPPNAKPIYHLWKHEAQLPENEFLAHRMTTIQRLLTENNIQDVTTLLPDGTIQHIPTSDLFSKPLLNSSDNKPVATEAAKQ